MCRMPRYLLSHCFATPSVIYTGGCWARSAFVSLYAVSFCATSVRASSPYFCSNSEAVEAEYTTTVRYLSIQFLTPPGHTGMLLGLLENPLNIHSLLVSNMKIIQDGPAFSHRYSWQLILDKPVKKIRRIGSRERRLAQALTILTLKLYCWQSHDCWSQNDYNTSSKEWNLGKGR